MPEREDRIIRFEQLNWLGKSVFLAGAAVRVTANVIEAAVDRAARIVADSERAFREGMDPNIDDAKILEEIEAPRKSQSE